MKATVVKVRHDNASARCLSFLPAIVTPETHLEVVVTTQQTTRLHLTRVQLLRLRTRVVGHVEEDVLLKVLPLDARGGEDDVVQVDPFDGRHLCLREDSAR